MDKAGCETINEWAEYEHAEIDRFVSYWKSKMKESPSEFRNAIPVGEFDKEYKLYQSLE